MEERHSKLVSEQQYPRIYSIRADTRRDFDAIATAPFAVVVAISLLDLAGLTNKSIPPSAFLVPGFLAGICALLGYQHNHRRVILYADGIEVLGWFSSRKLKRSEIRGYRHKGLSAS